VNGKKLEKEVQSLKSEIALKDLQIQHLKKLLYGQKSEKFNPDQWQLQLGLEDEPGKDQALPEEEEPVVPKQKIKSRKPRATKDELLPDDVTIKIKEVIIPAEVRANPDAWLEIGEEYHDELEMIPAQLYILRTIRKKYVSKEDRSLPPVICPAPLPTVPGTKCGASLMAGIITDRFVDHLPYYRQEKRYLRIFDATLGRNTLGYWTGQCAKYLKPINDAILDEVLSGPVVNVDETPNKYLEKGSGKAQLGYNWVYRQPAIPGGDNPGGVYFDWQTGRSHQCLLDILEVDENGKLKYQGIIQCDGYKAYETLSNRYDVTLAGCLAHVRRKFFEAAEESTNLCRQLLWLIQLLYGIEAEIRARALTGWHRQTIRNHQSRPILKKIYDTIIEEKEKHLPKSGIGKAIGYALNQRSRIELYLDDGNLEIDNNVVENAIRPNKLGAKNWMFIGAKEAGWRNALFYTMVENCRIQGVDPERYFTEMLRGLPSEEGAITPALARQWTPASYARRIRNEEPQLELTAA